MVQVSGKRGSKSPIEHVIKSPPFTVPGDPRPFFAFKPVLLSEGITESSKECFLYMSLLRLTPANYASVRKFGLRAIEITGHYNRVALLQC